MACEQAGRGRCAPSPLFPIGYEVDVDRYVGVVDGERHPHPITLCRVEAIRLLAFAVEDEAGNETLTCPKGWEYQLVSVQRAEEWGWEPEANLIAAGYEPPPHLPPGTEVVTLPHPDSLVTVAGVDGLRHAVPAADAPEF